MRQLDGLRGEVRFGHKLPIDAATSGHLDQIGGPESACLDPRVS
jgi:hypothetical protein